MYKGQPIQPESLLPAGMSPEAFYTLAGIAVVLLLGAVTVLPSFVKKRSRSARRLRMIQERRAELRGESMRNRRRNSRRSQESVNLMRRVVNHFHLLKSSGVASVQNLMIEAGFRSKDALVIYAFFTLATPIACLVIGLILLGTNPWGAGTMGTLLRYAVPVAMLYIGLKLPYWCVARRRKKRYYAIQKALSDTLDLMTICAEAGLSLAMALERVSRELGIAYPEMAEELALTSTELGFLPERNQALLNLTKRVTLPEIRGIISVLIQTEKYGTPIAQAMRVLSAEFREQRMLRAENKAARLPALMTVPMICFILPTLFIVIMSPAIIKVIDSTN